MEFCLGGGDGLISVTADVAPREMAELVKACRAGERQAAEAVNNKVRQVESRCAGAHRASRQAEAGSANHC